MTIPVLPRQQRALFAAVYAHPGLSVSELGSLAGIAPATAHQAAARLERCGLIVTRWDGNWRYCRPAPWTVGA